MTERINQLIDTLLLTTTSFEQGCLDCGFTAEDLTEAEIDAFYNEIFQCGYCGYWHENWEQEYDFCYGPVCSECYDSEHEEEEDE